MKRNITLSIDKELLVRAKIVAAKRQTSVNKMLADNLKALVDQSERYSAARKKALCDLEKGFHLGGQELPDREALHDRKDLR
ncbi:MAG: hypothetical protein Q7U02_07215 [Desulfosalsimonadaceae bacterium]|jgi:hypothetical protein|nr:hypothetical protein [Desulfosalsimonadaceae bacterium]